MRWTTKAAMLSCLSRLPFGRLLYRKLQEVSGSNRLDIANEYETKAMFLKRIQEQGITVSGKDILEIGTGWHPVLPFLFQLLGARHVVTIDLNPWLTTSACVATLNGLSQLVDRIVFDFAVPAECVKKRLAGLQSALGQAKGDPVDTLRQAGIEYRKPCRACATDLPKGSFDYLCSYNVLEHIPESGIREILLESQRILRPGGGHFHRINPGDHFAQDSRISTVNFLRFSPRSWYWIGGSGLAYHNRIRSPEYVRFFENAGFRVAYKDFKIDQRALKEIRVAKAPVHEGFRRYSSEQLACDVVEILAFWN